MSKILVICFSSINNVAMAIPVIHSLATQYAQHQIMVLSIDTFSPLFENVPDNVIFRGADFRGEHAGLMGLGWLYNDLKEEKFDAVAAFQPTFRSRFLCWRFRLAGIKAAHIKQNRRELQKLIRRKHKIYTEQDSFFQRCAHTLSQIGYPIRLSQVTLASLEFIVMSYGYPEENRNMYRVWTYANNSKEHYFQSFVGEDEWAGKTASEVRELLKASKWPSSSSYKVDAQFGQTWYGYSVAYDEAGIPTKVYKLWHTSPADTGDGFDNITGGTITVDIEELSE